MIKQKHNSHFIDEFTAIPNIFKIEQMEQKRVIKESTVILFLESSFFI